MLWSSSRRPYSDCQTSFVGGGEVCRWGVSHFFFYFLRQSLSLMRKFTTDGLPSRPKILLSETQEYATPFSIFIPYTTSSLSPELSLQLDDAGVTAWMLSWGRWDYISALLRLTGFYIFICHFVCSYVWRACVCVWHSIENEARGQLRGVSVLFQSLCGFRGSNSSHYA